MPDPCASISEFVEAYGAGDDARMATLLADDLVGYVTNAEGGVDRVEGPAAYRARLPDLATAAARVRITQTVQVAPDQALTMIEVKATRDDQALHNFGAFLSRIDAEGHICEIWMVDALPAYSDEFWS